MRLPLERTAKGNMRRTFLKDLEHVGVVWEECVSVAAAGHIGDNSLLPGVPCHTGRTIV